VVITAPTDVVEPSERLLELSEPEAVLELADPESVAVELSPNPTDCSKLVELAASET
jgi:hypothetical protein